MYETFFGLQEGPFSISPDPRFFFLSSQHKEALAKRQYAVQERMGLAVIYGDVGTDLPPANESSANVSV